MAPRKDDENPDGMVTDLTARTTPCRYIQKHSRKSMPLEVFDLNLGMNDLDLSKLTLAASFKRLSDRATALTNHVEDALRLVGHSLVLDACRFSLCSDLSSMMRENRVLLEKTGTEGSCFLMMIAPWRVSVAQQRTISYLDTIQSALEFSSRDILDSELRVATDLVSLNNRIDVDNEEKHRGTEFNLRVSPWTMPTLSFDLQVGSLVHHNIAADGSSSNTLPLKINVWAIVELSAEDITNGSAMVKSAPVCEVEVKKCNHEPHKHGGGAGIVGDACVNVKLSSIDKVSSKSPKTWVAGSPVETSMEVREARCVQVNAFPPKPQANVDLFTSTVYGDSGISISLCFETFQTLNDEVPEVNIELVVS